MDKERAYNSIKKIILSLLPDARILLFGSRARGTEDKHSDYDLLVITPQMFSRDENLSWSTKLHWALVRAIHAPFDLILCSEEEVQTTKELPGHIVRTALREGISL